jgi:hypothetical protein
LCSKRNGQFTCVRCNDTGLGGDCEWPSPSDPFVPPPHPRMIPAHDMNTYLWLNHWEQQENLRMVSDTATTRLQELEKAKSEGTAKILKALKFLETTVGHITSTQQLREGAPAISTPARPRSPSLATQDDRDGGRNALAKRRRWDAPLYIIPSDYCFDTIRAGRAFK